MQGKKILIVDDEPEIHQLIALYLIKEGFQVTTLEHGSSVIQYVKTIKPDLIILDILLPGIDGINLCKEIRKFTQIPILFLSCKTDELDIILGLEVGGDDYITKPFSPSQLVARVKANLRRNLFLSKPENESREKLIFPGLEIDLTTQEVYVNGKLVSLSTKEFDILVVLAKYPNRVFSIDELFHQIWGSYSLSDTRTLIVHISNLRKKIESDISNPKYILTVRGKGYKFNHTLQRTRQ